MYCSNCGTKLPENAKFCIECGQKIEEPPVREPEAAPCTMPEELPVSGPAAESSVTEPAADSSVSVPEPETPDEASVPEPIAAFEVTGTADGEPDGTQRVPEPEPAAGEPHEAAAAAGGAAEEAKPAGKKLPFIAIAVGGLVAVLAVLAIIISAAVNSNPMKIISTGLKNSAKALSQSGIAGLITDVADGGSISAEADIGGYLKESAGINIDASAAVAVYSDAENHSGAVAVSAGLNGSEIAGGTVWASPERIIVACDALLDNTYGINLEKLSGNLHGSLLDPDQNTELSMDKDTFEMLVKAASGNSAKDLEAFAEDTKELAEAAAETLFKSIYKHADISKNSETVSVGESSTKTTRVSVALDAVSLKEIADDCLDYLKTDKDLKAFIGDLPEKFGFILEEAGIDAGNLPEDFYEEITSLETIDLAKTLYSENFHATLDFYISKSGKQLIKIDFNIHTKYTDLSFSVFAGPDLKDIQYISAILDDDGSKTFVLYNVASNTSELYSATLTVTEGASSGFSYDASVVWNRKSGDFALKAGDYMVRAILLKNRDTYSIQVRSLAGSRSLESAGQVLQYITLYLDGDAKMPSAPSKYTEVLSLSENDCVNLMMHIQGALQELSSQLPDLF